MKTKKIVWFIVQGIPVEQLEATETNINDVEFLKTQLAAVHGVAYEDVEAITKDVVENELSETLIINPDGVLMKKGRANSFFVPVNSVRPAMDTTKEELFMEFLDLIFNNNIDNAIIFN